MASTLTAYNKKRKFADTPEPKGKAKGKNARQLQFVVQEHDASTLHYDFRLEAEGVLKSWAVPKGPSMDPADKRLAVMVEDHPLEYGKFEGTIPKGNYGAGTVKIWDKGWYEPDADSDDHNKAVVTGVKKGSLKFELHGKKLSGSFALVRMKGKTDKNWLLIKHKDKPARVAPPEKKMKAPVVGGKGDSKEVMVSIGNRTLRLTNLQKMMWPREGFTKGDLINYYQSIREYILPHIKGRPQSLKRNPNGIDAPAFFHKNAAGDAPSWVDHIKLYAANAGRHVDYIVCNNAATLAYLNNLGCIEINPWNSRTAKLDKPDYMVIDLDPSDNNSFDEVIEVALAVKDILTEAGVAGYCKTSGSSGLHIYIPLQAAYTYDEIAPFAKAIAEATVRRVPRLATTDRQLKKRRGRIYVDYLQNKEGQTLACVYSVRPVPGATVSTPLDWKEVKSGLKVSDFTMFNVLARLKKRSDLFREVLTGKTDLRLAMKKLETSKD